MQYMSSGPLFCSSPTCFGAGYWSVDAKAETAMGGVWKKGPGLDLFKALDQVCFFQNCPMSYEGRE